MSMQQQREINELKGEVETLKAAISALQAQFDLLRTMVSPATSDAEKPVLSLKKHA